MSSNIQFHVRTVMTTERFSFLRTLGPDGASLLRGVLQEWNDGKYPAEVVEEYPWEQVQGQEGEFRCQVMGHAIGLSFNRGVNPELTIEGRHSEDAAVTKAACAAVNAVVVRAVIESIARQVEQCREHGMMQKVPVRVKQAVALRALQRIRDRQVVQATCAFQRQR